MILRDDTISLMSFCTPKLDRKAEQISLWCGMEVISLETTPDAFFLIF
jgi:hypothetical protein